MKQFLYLDTDIVNSILAQTGKGLVTSLSSESETVESEEAGKDIGIELNGKIGGSLWKLAKAEADFSGALNTNEKGGYSYTSREIVAKTLHDAAFDMAYAAISPAQIADNDQSDEATGNYVELTRVFDFVDFDYLQGLFSCNGLIDFIKKNAAEEIEAKASMTINQMNRDQSRKGGANVRAEVKKKIEESNKQYDEIAKTISAIRSLIPHKRMLICHDGYLIPLSDQYFRVDHSDIGFKYGGIITCVGMITNIIGEDCDPQDNSNIFATLQHASNETLRLILPTKKKNLCVIHPIAVYYGE